MTLGHLGTRFSRTVELSDAGSAYLISQEAEGCTKATLEAIGYGIQSLSRFLDSIGVGDLRNLGPNEIRQYILHERRRGLKDRSVQSYLVNIKAFAVWCVREDYLPSNPFDNVRMPKVERKIIAAFTPAEIKKLLSGTNGKDPLSIRNRALVLDLLDTGLRASELISLRVGDVDLSTGMVTVTGKGRKQRQVRLGAQARKALLRYLRIRGGEEGEPLWIGVRGPLTTDGLHEVLTKLGKRVGVSPCNPHKFRRTFALNCLRNGMDPFSLQILMGHSDMQILRQYLAQTQADIQRAHEKHSPVDRMFDRRTA
ncbi:MAG: tyrosine-type recombinase/integrase [Armatimonadetes bacterium]|nr:tyrosine-type recombinase/integrase [Armatimonadota bacterium]